MTSLKKTHPLLKIAAKGLVVLPSPASLTNFWNFGSLLGVCLVIQLLTGLFLAMHYSCSIVSAFESVDHIMRDVSSGWLLRMAHANGASFFFICLYLHMARGLYYGSYASAPTWTAGVTIFLMVMATAFLGYVLPWGQMSFWGATVITNLFSAIPYLGTSIVTWLWGGFSVENPTLTRFFAFHFILPFIVAALSLIHLLFLHEQGSSNPLGLNSNLDKLTFHPYFSSKDILGFIFFFFLFLMVNFYAPWMLGDPENFIPANALVTPVHIQPEWYFLFAYAILRSIPNKLGGVIALVAAVLVFYTLPLYKTHFFKGNCFSLLSKIFFWSFVVIFVLLTWIGARPVEAPYIITGQILTGCYFIYFILIHFIWSMEQNLFFKGLPMSKS